MQSTLRSPSSCNALYTGNGQRRVSVLTLASTYPQVCARAEVCGCPKKGSPRPNNCIHCLTAPSRLGRVNLHRGMLVHSPVRSEAKHTYYQQAADSRPSAKRLAVVLTCPSHEYYLPYS
eukprot:scaffold165788_cov20-Tisochrysis_lutea.AAC.1